MGDIPGILPQVIQMRRHIHMHPELSCEERETTAYICNVFRGNGISYTVLPQNSGVVAQVGNGERAIGIRAELDALPIEELTGLPYASVNPGVMHACGHDMHLAAAIGFLLLLKPYEDQLPFAVKVFCQPAEETVGGAEQMIKLGCMKDPAVDTVFGFHIDPSHPAGTAAYLPGAMNAAVTDFELSIHGKSCHGARPQQGVDAIVAAAGVISALQTIPARRFAPTTPVVVTVGTVNGGTASNIVAGEVNMSGTLRTLDMAAMHKLKEDVRQVCEQTAQGYGAKASLTYTTSYPVLHNAPALTERTFAKVRTLLGEDKVVRMDAPSLGADDFAFFCQAADSCYFNIGCGGKDQKDGQILHSPYLAPDESCLETALNILCLLTD